MQSVSYPATQQARFSITDLLVARIKEWGQPLNTTVSIAVAIPEGVYFFICSYNRGR